MSEIKSNLQYTKTHEWLKNIDNNTWMMGIY